MSSLRAVFVIVHLLLLAACVGAPEKEGDGADRFPTSQDFPPSVMSRIGFDAAGPDPWKLSALKTPRTEPPPWKIVVVTGTPSWSEFWAPTLAKIGPDREMIVADRPGFAASEPRRAVTDISAQADALAAMLDGPADQKVLLIGQSYGGPIATLIAARHPEKVKALVLMSAFFGERGPTIKRLDALGSLVRPVLPRDMKNAMAELTNQKPQLPAAFEALDALDIPVIVLHGDKDDFIPYEAAERLAKRAGAKGHFIRAPGGDHFLNACCVPNVVTAIDIAIAAADGGFGEGGASTRGGVPH